MAKRQIRPSAPSTVTCRADRACWPRVACRFGMKVKETWARSAEGEGLEKDGVDWARRRWSGVSRLHPREEPDYGFVISIGNARETGYEHVWRVGGSECAMVGLSWCTHPMVTTLLLRLMDAPGGTLHCQLIGLSQARRLRSDWEGTLPTSEAWKGKCPRCTPLYPVANMSHLGPARGIIPSTATTSSSSATTNRCLGVGPGSSFLLGLLRGPPLEATCRGACGKARPT